MSATSAPGGPAPILSNTRSASPSRSRRWARLAAPVAAAILLLGVARSSQAALSASASPTDLFLQNFDAQATGPVTTGPTGLIGSGVDQFSAVSGSSRLSVESDTAASAPNALRVGINGGGQAFLAKQYPAGTSYPTHSVSLALKLSSNLQIPSGQYLSFLQTEPSTSSKAGMATVSLLSDHTLELYYVDAQGTGHSARTSSPLGVGSFHQVELDESAGSPGTLALLVDGATVLTAGNADIGPSGVSWFATGLTYAPLGKGYVGSFYVDDVTTTVPGTTSSTGHATNSPVATTTTTAAPSSTTTTAAPSSTTASKPSPVTTTTTSPPSLVSGPAPGGCSGDAPPSAVTVSTLEFCDTFSSLANWNTYITSKGANGTPWFSNGSGGSAEGSQYNADYDLPSHVAAGSGGLSMTATLGSSQSGYTWTGGAVSSYGHEEWDGGYIGVTAKEPGGVGTWPAIWLLPGPGAVTTTDNFEIDMQEGGMTWGSTPVNDLVSWHLHSNNSSETGTSTNVGEDLSAGYHTYAIWWVPGQSITWYLDGKAIGSVTSSQFPIPSEPMEMIINDSLAASSASAWHTVWNSSTPSPSTFTVSKVEVWG